MKRSAKRLSALLSALAVLLAFCLGLGLDGIRRLSVLWVDRLFPVAYHVEYYDAATAQQVRLLGAPVYFSNGEAVISARDGQLRLSPDAVRLTCADTAAQGRNQNRAFFLSAGLCLFFAAAALGLVSLAALRREKRCRRRVRPIQPQRPRLTGAA